MNRTHGDGDWICPTEGCGNINFARRMECNRCMTPRADMPKKQVGEKKGLFGPGDWACGKCGNMNWERRNECNICKSQKSTLGPDERRDGAGGGFNERQDRVASARREVDEDGYDDFGQRRQKAKLSKAEREAASLARLKSSYSALYDNGHDSYSDDDKEKKRRSRSPAPRGSERRPSPHRRRSPNRRKSPDRSPIRRRSTERRNSRSRDRHERSSRRSRSRERRR